MTPIVSVIICTRNRAAYLEASITSVLQQSDGEPVELIVVDNASTDATAAIVHRFAQAGRLRCALEPTLGLSHARNTGRRLARGRYIAFLDDDAVAMPGWLSAIPRAFGSAPAVAVVGGPVEPIWEAERPAWLSDELAMGLSVVDWSSEPKRLRDIDREWLVGANMAFDASVLDELGGFQTALGRQGERLLSGEETDLQRRAVHRGYACVYWPAMRVCHVIAASRLRKAWFRRRYFWQGVSDAVVELADAPAMSTRVRRGVEATLHVFGNRKKLRDLVTDSDNPSEFARRTFLLAEVGRAAGLLGLARRSI